MELLFLMVLFSLTERLYRFYFPHLELLTLLIHMLQIMLLDFSVPKQRFQKMKTRPFLIML